MKILWIEDFGGGLNGHRLALEIFGEFISKGDLDRDEELSFQLPQAINHNSNNTLYLCQSYIEYEETRIKEKGEFDIIIIDINLERIPTPPERIPKNEIRNKFFDNLAGTYIYKELIKSGFPENQIAFFTAEAGSLRAFKELCNRTPNMSLPKNTFEKKPSDYTEVRKWLTNQLTSLSNA